MHIVHLLGITIGDNPSLLRHYVKQVLTDEMRWRPVYVKNFQHHYICVKCKRLHIVCTSSSILPLYIISWFVCFCVQIVLCFYTQKPSAGTKLFVSTYLADQPYSDSKVLNK